MRVSLLAAVCVVALAASTARADDEFDGAPEHNLAAAESSSSSVASSRQSDGLTNAGQQHVLSFLICQS